LFGGVSEVTSLAEPPAPNCELYLMQLRGSNVTWSCPSTTGGPPSPRWQHTATPVDGTRLFVFGGNLSNQARLNDMWLLDSMSMEWAEQGAPVGGKAKQRSKGAMGGDGEGEYKQSGPSGAPNAPAPRSAHSACLIDRNIFIFGGYGGSGFRRADFNDLYGFNVDSMTWTRFSEVQGEPPAKRSGHAAVTVKQLMLVSGGWSRGTRFNDLHSFDTETLTWTHVESGTVDPPRWMHSAMSVVAVPSWQVFVFGGCSGDDESFRSQGQFMNDAWVLDTGRMRWSQLEVENAPAPRSEAAMSFDETNKRILVHGGWANQWFNDVHVLDVAPIVGPPYAITELEPRCGPVTGGTRLVIKGLGFDTRVPATCRFTLGKKFVDGTGKVVSPTEIHLDAPAFESMGAGDAVLRLIFKGGRPTITYEEFQMFAVTEGSRCLAFGPGVLSGGAPGHPTFFRIQAINTEGKYRTLGGDEFSVRVVRVEVGEDGEEVPPAAADDDSHDIPCSLVDNEDGSYTASYTAPEACRVKVFVEFDGTFGGAEGPVFGSPFTCDFAEGADKANNKMEGPLVLDHLKSTIKGAGLFAKKTYDGLTRDVPADSLPILLDVKTHLHNVNAKAAEQEGNMNHARATVTFLKASGSLSKAQSREVERYRKGLDAASKQWDEAKMQAPITKNGIQPLVRSHGADTKKRVQAYEGAVYEFSQAQNKHKFWRYDVGVSGALTSLDKADNELERSQEDFKKMLHLATMFDYAPLMTESKKMLDEVRENNSVARKLWALTQEVEGTFTSFKEEKWAEVDADDMESKAKKLHKRMKNTANKKLRTTMAYRGLDRFIKDFLLSCPLIMALSHPSMRPRHWQMLMKATGKTFTPPHENADMKLGELLALELHNFNMDVEEITDQALKEEKMEQTLAQLDETWSAIEFLQAPYKEGATVNVLKINDDDFDLLEQDQLTVQGMMASRFLATFEEEVTSWQKALAMVAEVIQQLSEVQRTWSYLEPLFIGSDEVRKELPEDAERFETIDVRVKKVLVKASETSNIRDACNEPGLYDELEAISGQLDLCKKSLADFLAAKRRCFPRFYFTSEADLLDILSNGSQPHKIIHHVTKVMLATATLELQEREGQRPTSAKWIASVGREEVEFEPAIELLGKVEVYLQTALDAQKSTLNKKLQRCLKRYPTQSRVDWLMHRDPKTGNAADPAQVALFVAGSRYVQEVNNAFGRLLDDPEAMQAQLDLIVHQLKELIILTQGKLSKGDRQRVMCMITMDAHSRDIITRLLRERVTDIDQFQWQSQLKQVYENNMAELRIADAIVAYGYEYLGNGGRLVVTPLTDRIYVTATQALNLKMGCAPAGPAGTGKTETTKDLASAAGKCCYVFNCAPEMDYKGMGNIFKGLASSGSWGCFDEFNRLMPEVLSVCSVQFKAVCDGKKADKTRIVIEGEEVALDDTCGVFITMNPGYLGRSELPEGLKTLFRPMTVMVPDLVLICENMMMAEGFTHAKVLASKFYGLYSLLAELLSKQLHYDWGLRAVKSVLVVAGGFKRADPDLPEQDLLMRALRDFNTPKIVQQDEVVFFGLLGDLFPGINPPRKINEALETAVEQATRDAKLHPDENFLLKVVQLEELLEIRHCVFVMGPPGAGKSQCWRVLAKARALLGKEFRTKFVDLNPKSVSPQELYGYITMATREWKDGLLSKMLRDLGQERTLTPKWMILDGDLDTNWIESMNSVMDDNKMLTLASNERIPLKPHMRMLFEIRDLVYASPATVSRAGMLYISAATGFQWRALIKSWLVKLQDHPVEAPSEVTDVLEKCFDKYVAPVLLFLKKETKPLVALQDMAMVNTLLRMLDQLLTKDLCKGMAADAKNMAKYVETWFVFAAVWAFGSTLTLKDGEDYRKKFSDFWRGEFKAVRIPSRETVFDYYLDPEAMSFDVWKNSPYFTEIEYDSSTPMSSVTVPTPETASITYWMRLLVHDDVPVMLAGYAGCGKTQLVTGLLQSLDEAERLHANINFNFYTSSTALQVNLETPLEKKTGTNWGPPGKAKMVFFVDDLNLPELDVYNTQSAIALIRQHMDYGHWYDRNKLQLRTVSNCQYISALNPTAGSFIINPRLQRHFVTFAIGFPGPTSLHTIYNTFLNGHLKTFDENIQTLTGSLVNAALGLHAQVANTFRKSAVNFHYEFNIRHLSNVFQGLLVAQPEQFTEPAKFVQLWLHESERVYGDRLVSYEDLGKYKQLAQAQAKKRFPAFNMSAFFAAENADPLIFCHFVENVNEKNYDKVADMKKLHEILMGALEDYNEANSVMDLVLFEDAMRHVCRISRIILNEGGHALLVGVGGSGKQSLSRLASSICGYTVMQIVISGTYGINDLKDDLKAMYAKAGMKEEGITFLFTDSQISNERFLVYINDLLASGFIPDLYADDEIDEICNAVTPRVKEAGIIPDRKPCFDFFLQEVRKNLHVILCFSPVGEDFRVRATRFPALVNSTVIDWFQPWPKEALSSVAAKVLSNIELPSDEVRDGIRRFLPESFENMNDAARRYKSTNGRYVYTTPKSYLELLKLYETMLARKRDESANAIDRLANGLAKLRDTAEAVVEIEANLKIKLAAAEEKMRTSEAIAVQVSANKEVVEEETRKANIEARDVAALQKDVMALQKSASEDLAKAEPAVEAAMAALNTLNKKDLSECKTMATPPKGVDDVFAAVVSLMAGTKDCPLANNIITTKSGVVKAKDKDWTACKKALLGNVNEFISTLKGFKALVDAYKVPDVNWGNKGVRPYIGLEHFTPEVIATKNKAAAGLCSWVVNLVIYRDILITVEPKRKALREANDQLEEANARLDAVNQKVAGLQATLDKLTTELNAANAEKDSAVAAVEAGQQKLDLANRLTSALADENVRWAEGIEQLTADKELLVGDVLLASAFISYIGPFTKRYRDEMITQQWMPFLETAANGERIPMSDDPNPLSILTTEAEIAQWNADSLPDDRVSLENGAIVENTARWPLMIDPQLQGIRWVRNKESEEGRKLVVLRLGMKNMLTMLERAIDAGMPVLLENLGERIDAVLNPVISRATSRKGHKQYLKLGDKEVEFHPRFRLYLHTKLSNPHYPPEIQAETALINFTVTEAGLEDQLLSLVVGKERPDLAEMKSELVQQQNMFKIKIKNLEDDILARLAAAEGDITADVDLIEGLENTKRIANEIVEKQTVAVATEKAINETSEKYRGVAERGALLFFLMNELFRVHTYYIYSLNAFVVVFLRAIDLVSGENDPNYQGDHDEDDEDHAMLDSEDEGAEDGEEGKGEGKGEDGEDGEDGEGEGGEGEAAANGVNIKPGLDDVALAERCKVLMESITGVAFNYLRRGVFETDKLTIATQLCLRIMVRAGQLEAEHVNTLIMGPLSTDPGNSGPLSDWMPANIWARVKGLEAVRPQLGKIGDDMQNQSAQWQRWFDAEKPDQIPCPGQYARVKPLYKLLILRAMRPDRLSAALVNFISKNMGEAYVSQQAFDMGATFEESTSSTPIFFVLFPGVDPTLWVETLGKQLGFSLDNGKFMNISMGQGQEPVAEQALNTFARDGGWLMLQNLHLMQTWVKKLERQLELLEATAHKDFRCFISAEPPTLSYMKNMPESLMQTCIKVANEAPADLQSNLRRAWANFDQDRLNDSNKKGQYQACLFTMCFYHAIVQGRRRFGQQGWSKRYSFNQGDLYVCSNILMDYINRNVDVPWDDLRYIFGEIMYGGHITDAWDRRTNNTYVASSLVGFHQPAAACVCVGGGGGGRGGGGVVGGGGGGGGGGIAGCLGCLEEGSEGGNNVSYDVVVFGCVCFVVVVVVMQTTTGTCVCTCAPTSCPGWSCARASRCLT